MVESTPEARSLAARIEEADPFWTREESQSALTSYLLGGRAVPHTYEGDWAENVAQLSLRDAQTHKSPHTLADLHSALSAALCGLPFELGSGQARIWRAILAQSMARLYSDSDGPTRGYNAITVELAEAMEIRDLTRHGGEVCHVIGLLAYIRSPPVVTVVAGGVGAVSAEMELAALGRGKDADMKDFVPELSSPESPSGVPDTDFPEDVGVADMGTDAAVPSLGGSGNAEAFDEVLLYATGEHVEMATKGLSRMLYTKFAADIMSSSLGSRTLAMIRARTVAGTMSTATRHVALASLAIRTIDHLNRVRSRAEIASMGSGPLTQQAQKLHNRMLAMQRTVLHVGQTLSDPAKHNLTALAAAFPDEDTRRHLDLATNGGSVKIWRNALPAVPLVVAISRESDPDNDSFHRPLCAPILLGTTEPPRALPSRANGDGGDAVVPIKQQQTVVEIPSGVFAHDMGGSAAWARATLAVYATEKKEKEKWDALDAATREVKNAPNDKTLNEARDVAIAALLHYRAMHTYIAENMQSKEAGERRRFLDKLLMDRNVVYTVEDVKEKAKKSGDDNVYVWDPRFNDGHITTPDGLPMTPGRWLEELCEDCKAEAAKDKVTRLSDSLRGITTLFDVTSIGDEKANAENAQWMSESVRAFDMERFTDNAVIREVVTGSRSIMNVGSSASTEEGDGGGKVAWSKFLSAVNDALKTPEAGIEGIKGWAMLLSRVGRTFIRAFFGWSQSAKYRLIQPFYAAYSEYSGTPIPVMLATSEKTKTGEIVEVPVTVQVVSLLFQELSGNKISQRTAKATSGKNVLFGDTFQNLLSQIFQRAVSRQAQSVSGTAIAADNFDMDSREWRTKIERTLQEILLCRKEMATLLVGFLCDAAIALTTSGNVPLPERKNASATQTLVDNYGPLFSKGFPLTRVGARTPDRFGGVSEPMRTLLSTGRTRKLFRSALGGSSGSSNLSAHVIAAILDANQCFAAMRAHASGTWNARALAVSWKEDEAFFEKVLSRAVALDLNNLTDPNTKNDDRFAVMMAPFVRRFARLVEAHNMGSGSTQRPIYKYACGASMTTRQVKEGGELDLESSDVWDFFQKVKNNELPNTWKNFTVDMLRVHRWHGQEISSRDLVWSAYFSAALQRELSNRDGALCQAKPTPAQDLAQEEERKPGANKKPDDGPAAAGHPTDAAGQGSGVLDARDLGSESE